MNADIYAELHCISNFSFLRGASRPEELVQQARQLGYHALAITDECSLAGVVRAHQAAQELKLPLIVGAQFQIEDLHLVLLATNRRAYGQLAQWITLGRRRCEKGEYSLQLRDIERNHPQLSECIALWVPNHRRDRHLNFRLGERLKLWFEQRLWITLERFLEADDLDKVAELLTLSSRLKLPLVAAGDVYMHQSQRKPLQDVLSAIRLGTAVPSAGRELQANCEHYLRSLPELLKIYPQELLSESVEIANRCHFSLDELRYEYPEEVVPPGLTPSAYLRQLTLHGAKHRWPSGIPNQASELIEKELQIIAELRYEHFFLTVYDIVQFARANNILCQGRGSAANSAVCYCLQITEVDPARMNVLFERFISKERHEPPDIDVDFEHERREEVIQYIYKRYGRDRTALTATVITYRPRSAVRDVGKAMGLDPTLVDHLAKSLAWWDQREDLVERFAHAGIRADSPVIQQFLLLVREIIGFPRHLSQHPGGFVISAGPLAQLVPIENAAMDDRTVIQWDKDDLDTLGLLKVDVLGLGMLTAIRKAMSLANDYHDLRTNPLRLDTIPAEDPDTYRMLQRADSVGVFQVESRAQMAMLPRLKPERFYDLVIEVAIVRPGPIQGNMVHPYLRRRQKLEEVSYPTEAVRTVLQRTLGVPIFQEQVIQLAMAAAGFSAGEADRLRRAMAAWRRRGGLEAFEEKLINGMLERGHDRDFAERVFAQIKGFGEYGFPESHAASFALLVYVSAWLKRHEPTAFYCGLLNSQPMGFYTPAQIVQDAKRHGIEVRPIEVSTSQWDHTLETPSHASTTAEDPVLQYDYRRNQPALRLGLRLVKGLDEAAGRRIERCTRQPLTVAQLATEAHLDSGHLRCLARAGALEALAGNRHQAHWAVHGYLPALPLARENTTAARSSLEPSPHAVNDEAVAHDASQQLGQPSDPSRNMSRLVASSDFDHNQVELPAPTLVQEMTADYAFSGLSLRAHPIALLRTRAPFNRCLTAKTLQRYPHGRFARIAGLVTGRQRPSTASGVIFLTLEDETGNSNVVIWSSVLARYRHMVLHGKIILVKGVVEREGEVVHVIAGALTNLDHHLGQLDIPSRDFH